VHPAAAPPAGVPPAPRVVAPGADRACSSGSSARPWVPSRRPPTGGPPSASWARTETPAGDTTPGDVLAAHGDLRGRACGTPPGLAGTPPPVPHRHRSGPVGPAAPAAHRVTPLAPMRPGNSPDRRVSWSPVALHDDHNVPWSHEPLEE